MMIKVKRLRVILLFVSAFVLLYTTCSNPTPNNSPLFLQSPFYSPVLTPIINKVHFALDVPLLQGMNYVTGRGPAGIHLQVVDVTGGGEIIGSGVIGNDNKFKINLVIPLKPNRMICIELATPREPETWLALWELRGENARVIPQMGYYFDCAITEFQTTPTP